MHIYLFLLSVNNQSAPCLSVISGQGRELGLPELETPFPRNAGESRRKKKILLLRYLPQFNH